VSSKRKSIANRQLQRRSPSVEKVVKPTAQRKMHSVREVPEVAVAPAVFCETTYGQAKSGYQMLVDNTCGEHSDLANIMRTVVQHELNGGGRDRALEMRPYIVKYVGECRARQSAAGHAQ
jgi:hypothetical protein